MSFFFLNFLDAWLWMGWYFQKVPCGFSLHVVAFKSCPGVFIQVLPSISNYKKQTFSNFTFGCVLESVENIRM